MSKKREQIRQGDVLLVPVTKVPSKLKKRKDRTIALGESTGHTHTLTKGTVFGEIGGTQFVVAERVTSIEHLPNPGVEHDTLPLVAGPYEVAIQVEETALISARRVQE